MAVVAMSKIQILLHNADKAKVLETLQECGVMEIIDSAESQFASLNEEAIHKLDFEIAEIDFALRFLTKYAAPTKGVEAMFLGDKIKVDSLDAVAALRKSFAYRSIVEKCQNLEEEINRKKARLIEVNHEFAEFEPWENLKLDLALLRETETTKLLIGSLPRRQAADCLAEIEEHVLLSEQNIISEQKDPETRFWVLVDKKNLETVEAILQGYGFSAFVPAFREGTPHEILKALIQEKKTILKQFDAFEKEGEELAYNIPNLKKMYDYLHWLKGREEIKQNFSTTEMVTVILGFVPKERLAELEKVLSEVSANIFVEELQITSEDQVPVALKNKNFVRPFEGVMKLFGLPASSELDPTPYLTPFFLVFFGFCLTDVGYGLILGIGLWILLKTIKFPEDLKSMLRLLMYAGWVTVVMGVLFGGYFGLTVDQAPAWMVNPETGLFKFQIFDPINNLNVVMGFAYGLGLLQLWLGTFLKGLNQWKNNKAEALQTSFIYNLLIVFVIFLTLAKTGVLFAGVADLLEKVVYVNIALAIWGSGYGQKWFVRPLIGAIVFLQEIINIFSAVLSYSRLFALGMSTGIIALVFNTIALTTLDLMPPFAAIPVMIIVIVVGHILNIALNVLGAFIHSARLQFVEFFGKFLAGGGKDFTPFKREMKYLVFDSVKKN